MPTVRRNRPGTIKTFAKTLRRAPRLRNRLTENTTDRAQNPAAIARCDASLKLLGVMKKYTIINAADAAEPIIRPRHPEQNSKSHQAIL